MIVSIPAAHLRMRCGDQVKQSMMLRCCWSDVTSPPWQRPTGAGAPRPRLSPRDTSERNDRSVSLHACALVDRLRHCSVYLYTSASQLTLSLRKQLTCERFMFSNLLLNCKTSVSSVAARIGVFNLRKDAKLLVKVSRNIERLRLWLFGLPF